MLDLFGNHIVGFPTRRLILPLQETEKGKFTPTDDYIAHVAVTKDNKNVFLVTDKLVFLIVLNALRHTKCKFVAKFYSYWVFFTKILINIFVFAAQIVQSLFFKNPKY